MKVEKIEKTAIKKQAVLGNVKEVLSSQKLKDGSEFRMVRLENGVVKKQLINTRKKLQQTITTHSKSISNADLISATAESSINEGFEGWDGEKKDWLPDGWVDDSKAGSPSDVADVWGDIKNFTWTTSDGGYFTPALTGQYCAGVQFATIYQVEEDVDITPPSPQDEWLISPSVTVKQADYVYAFDLYYDPFWARLSEFDDDWNPLFGDMHTIVEAYISVDGGEWVKKWDSREDALSYTEDELYDIEMNSIFPWVKVNIDLKEYVNKDINVAIRYWDDGGESVYVDNVTVGYRLPGASYRRPEGYLISGFSKEYYSLTELNLIFGNAYTSTQWSSYIENADNVTWEFDGYGIRNEENPVVTIPYGLYENPILSASGKGGSVEYQLGVAGDENLLAVGGENLWTFEDGDFLFGLGNYDLQYGLSVIPEANAEYVSDYGTFKGIGNYYEKPAGKFMFETFYVHAGNVVAKTGEPVKLTIYAVDEEGNVGDAIATSEAWPGDFTQLEAEEGDEYIYYTIPFKFKEIDPETGREANSRIEIESAFLAEFSNYESADVIFQGDNRSGENYAYVTLEEGFISMESWGLNTSCLFDMDAVFPYLYAEDNKFAVPENGGVKTFKLESYWLPDDWKFEDLPNWITVNDDFVTDEEAGTVTFSVTAAALPDGFSGRNADVKIQSFACDQILQFKQGDSSFTGLTSLKTASVKVVRQGNNFVLSYPERTNTVAVYNITGQKIKEYSLSGSTTQTISANDLAKGVYIFKFSGKTNESLKVVR
ncbi:hypothetical protein FACS1894123_07590 [Bacteroidia bacterium]|nr:hypothetical protein FACS1894123_07590 [Bacteroidia bacterium]